MEPVSNGSPLFFYEIERAFSMDLHPEFTITPMKNGFSGPHSSLFLKRPECRVRSWREENGEKARLFGTQPRRYGKSGTRF